MSSTWLAPSLAACALLVSSAGCGRTHYTIIEEEVVDEEDPTLPVGEKDASSRSPPTTRPSDVDAGRSDAGPADGERCASKASNEDCRICCRVTSDDEAACIQAARCDALPTPDDCRSKGCPETQQCALCWGRWECLPENRVC